MALIFIAGCSCGGPDVIPRKKMASIYAEMLVVDQWVIAHPGLRTKADTSLVYEPILEKYGYDTEDYRASVEYYMNDPERYSRILRRTTEILDQRLEDLKVLKAKEDRIKAIVPVKLARERLYYLRSVDQAWSRGDSAAIEVDSVSAVFELKLYETSDTLYEGLEIVLRQKDTLAAGDSLAAGDTLALGDSLAFGDSLATGDSSATADSLAARDTLLSADTLARNMKRIKEGDVRQSRLFLLKNLDSLKKKK